MVSNYVEFDTGPYLNPLVDNSFNSFLLYNNDDRGANLTSTNEETAKTAAKEELVIGISQGNMNAMGQLVTGVFEKSQNHKNQTSS